MCTDMTDMSLLSNFCVFCRNVEILQFDRLSDNNILKAYVELAFILQTSKLEEVKSKIRSCEKSDGKIILQGSKGTGKSLTSVVVFVSLYKELNC